MITLGVGVAIILAITARIIGFVEALSVVGIAIAVTALVVGSMYLEVTFLGTVSL